MMLAVGIKHSYNPAEGFPRIMPSLRCQRPRTNTQAQAPWTLSHSIVVIVDDVDGHHERVRAGGARIVSETEDKPWGLRQYTAVDPEGHRWEFSQYVRDAPPSEWGAELTDHADFE